MNNNHLPDASHRCIKCGRYITIGEMKSRGHIVGNYLCPTCKDIENSIRNQNRFGATEKYEPLTSKEYYNQFKHIEKMMKSDNKVYTPENITRLKKNQIFVFGSNLSGMHGAGAAAQAVKFGAEMGVGWGLTGKTYAIPTLKFSDKKKRVWSSYHKKMIWSHVLEKLDLDYLETFVDQFIKFAKDNPDLEFLVTKIGCGIAGFTCDEISNLFKNKDLPTNIIFPKEFKL